MSSCKCLSLAPLCYQKESVIQINVFSQRAVIGVPSARPALSLVLPFRKGLVRLRLQQMSTCLSLQVAGRSLLS